MNPKLIELNPAFADLPLDIQEEVEKRMSNEAAYFLVMNRVEIIKYFEDERRAEEEGLRRIEEERIKKNKEEKIAKRQKTKRSIMNFLLRNGLVGSCYMARFIISALLALGLYFISVYLISIPIIYFIVSCLFGCSSCGTCPYKVESFEV